jgi:hypothetical protein
MTSRITRRRMPGWRQERPDWLLVGWTNRDGSVTLVASTKLTVADVEPAARTYEYRDFDEMRARLAEDMQFDLKARMDDYLTVTAATYPEAMADLFRIWTPEKATRPELVAAAYEATQPPPKPRPEPRFLAGRSRPTQQPSTIEGESQEGPPE